jgi:hypothetical protein
MEDRDSRKEPTKVPEARYAYYRRCQVFRDNGEQCKAPAEKEAQMCHAHRNQQAMELRRQMELTSVLAEAACKMRQRGKPDFRIADIFTDFKAIQVTLATMAQALITGRIDCKTAGRLGAGLQRATKVLGMLRSIEKTCLPEMHADGRRSRGSLEGKNQPNQTDMLEILGRQSCVIEQPTQTGRDKSGVSLLVDVSS